MKFHLFFVPILLLAFSARGTSAALCNLCETGVEGINWPHHHVDSHGKTCVQKSIDMAFLDDGSSICQSEVAAHRNRCCGPNEPGPIQQTPTKPPTYNGPTGAYKKCSLCRDGDYPSQTSMVITMLYVGSGSCAQFYDYAANGLIQTHLCEPLQFFAYEPCGCGEFNTNLQQAPPPQITEQQQQQQQAATPSPTPQPTVMPTTRPPSLRPTHHPTYAPTTPQPTLPPTPPATLLARTPQPTLPPTPQPTNVATSSNNVSNSESSNSSNGGKNTKAPKRDAAKESLKIGKQGGRGGAGGHRYLKGSR